MKLRITCDMSPEGEVEKTFVGKSAKEIKRYLIDESQDEPSVQVISVRLFSEKGKILDSSEDFESDIDKALQLVQNKVDTISDSLFSLDLPQARELKDIILELALIRGIIERT